MNEGKSGRSPEADGSGGDLAEQRDQVMKNELQVREFIKVTIEGLSLGRLQKDVIGDDQVLLEELGLDSLDYAMVMLACEEWMGMKVREEGVDWRNIRTVRQLARFMHSQQSQ